MASTACMSLLTFLIPPVLVLAVTAGVQGDLPVSCTAGTVVVGQQASITCNFHRDINATRHNFNIVHHPLNRSASPQDSGTYLLLCNWGRDGILLCKTEEGYSFDGKVSSELTLTINRVWFDNAGLYVCQLVPDSGLRLDPCNLTVTHCPISMDQESRVTEDYSKSVDQAPRETKDPSFIIAALAILIAVLVVLLILSHRTKIVRFWRRIRRQHPSRAPEEGGNEAKEENDTALLADLCDIRYPPNTAHKQTHTYLPTMDRDTQVGTNFAVLAHERFTQVIEKDREMFTGNLKANEGDVVLTGSASRYNAQVYVTLGTPLVVVPEAVVEKMRLRTELSQSQVADACV